MRLFTKGLENNNVMGESDVCVYLRKVSRTVMSWVKAMCASIYEGLENSNAIGESDVRVYLRKFSRTVMSGVDADVCGS